MKRLLLRAMLWLLAIGSLFYFALCLYLVWNETNLVYPAAAESYGANIKFAALPSLKSVRYQTVDKVTLTGRLLERPASSRYLIFFHGNGERAKWLDQWAVELSQQFDATVLLAEYRGFDDAQYTPTESALIDDGLAACDLMCQRFELQPDEIIFYGRSLGGGVAVAVAAKYQAKLLVLERTFDRLVDVSAERFWFIPVRLLMRNRFDSLSRIKSYHGPVIQVHGTGDSLIPIKHGKILNSKAPGPALWIEVDGMGHNDHLPAATLQEIANAVSEFSRTDG